MNATERLGRGWLIESMGIAPSDLTFQRGGSPDFLSRDGRGWEIKLAAGRLVLFGSTQCRRLRDHGDVTIVLFRPRGASPELIVPFRDLTIPGTYRGFDLRLTLTGRALRLDKDVEHLVGIAAASDRVTSHAWIVEAIREQLLLDAGRDKDGALAAAMTTLGKD